MVIEDLYPNNVLTDKWFLYNMIPKSMGFSRGEITEFSFFGFYLDPFK